jgi:hypothetical protein
MKHVNHSGLIHRSVLWLLLIGASLSACSDENGTQVSGTGETITAEATVQPTPDATSTPTPQPTVTPKPLTPLIVAADQALEEDGRLIVERVDASEPSWVVIQADAGGEPGTIIGFTALDEGKHEFVEVTVDPVEATPRLYAVMYTDAGQGGIFEYPGPDTPTRSEQAPVIAAFEVENRALVPGIIASDQQLSEDEMIVIDSVTATGPSWLAIHDDDDGQPGRMLNFTSLPQGSSENISLFIPWRDASPTLHAVLYEDVGQPNQFEYPDGDPPVTVFGQEVAATFRVRYPPDIYALDQPLVDGQIVVERAVSYGPGWAVVYRSDDGQPGTIIGWSHLDDGINTGVVVSVTQSAATPELYLRLHEDTEPVDEFGFPGSDPAVRYRERLPQAVPFRTDGASYIITQDQPLSADDTVTVPVVVSDQDAWVVIYGDSGGELGAIIGQSWVAAGISRDVSVTIDPDMTTTTLYAVLHADAGTSEQFEYPNGPDTPLQRNRDVINTPFALLASDIFS